MIARALVLAVCLLAAACSKGGEPVYQGYVEGEFVYVASQLAGRLDDLPVSRGMWVRPGDPLFTLEHELERQGVERAQASLKKSQSTLDDLKKGLRPEELDQILARIEKAEADLALAKLEMDRRQKLLATGAVSQEEYDSRRAWYLMTKGTLADQKAQLATGKLGSRIDQILAARDQVSAAQAELEQSRWYLDQKRQASTLEARVFDLLHYKGEWVQAGSPVVKLLPPANVKVRFFVPETVVGGVRPGVKVTARCDGCPAPVAGTVTYIAPQAEYTPPVIYSQEFRAKLVFMIEARFDPATARTLNPGQPVDVRLEAAQ